MNMQTLLAIHYDGDITRDELVDNIDELVWFKLQTAEHGSHDLDLAAAYVDEYPLDLEVL
jgi:hypothetical protein